MSTVVVDDIGLLVTCEPSLGEGPLGLVRDAAHGEWPAKLVPLDLVDTGGADTGGAGPAKGELRLRCTRAGCSPIRR